MKKYLLSLLFIFLPVLAGLVVLEILARHVPNDYAYKNNWLRQHSDKVEVLALGSSHGYYGINPELFSYLTFNGGHVSQDLKRDAFIFEKYTFRNLKCLILPISYFTLCSSLEGGSEAWRVKYYEIYYHQLAHPLEFKYNFEIADLRSATQSIYSYYIKKKDRMNITSRGWGTNYSLSGRTAPLNESGPIAAKRHTKNIDTQIERIEQNVATLKHVIQVCHDRGVKVIVLTTPTHPYYYKNLNENQLNDMVRYCTQLTSQFDNAVYLNLLKSYDFEEHDFYDADHLDEFGAEKLSRILNGYVHDLLKMHHSNLPRLGLSSTY